MKSTTAMPAKSALVKCTLCSLVAHAPIVVPLGEADAGAKARPGRCSSRDACDLRVRRAINRGKAKP
jgi:hypothetical protein